MDVYEELWELKHNFDDLLSEYGKKCSAYRKLEKQLEIALKALHGYNAYYDSNWSDDFEWFDTKGNCVHGWVLADNAFKQIEELNNE